MSAELQELRRLALRERTRVWEHAKQVPGCIGDAAGAYTKVHPLLAMGAAAALSTMLAARRARRFGTKGRASRWFTAAAAFGVRLLPDLLKVAGLTANRMQTKPSPPPASTPQVPVN